MARHSDIKVSFTEVLLDGIRECIEEVLEFSVLSVFEIESDVGRREEGKLPLIKSRLSLDERRAGRFCSIMSKGT
jgi:hypothetical protein